MAHSTRVLIVVLGLVAPVLAQPPVETQPPLAQGSASVRRVKRVLATSTPGLTLGPLADPDPVPDWVPRFEEHVDVEGRNAADALADQFAGFDGRGPVPANAPTHAELRDAADHQPAPAADLLGAALLLAKNVIRMLRGQPEAQYYVYVLRVGSTVTPLLREGRVPAQALEGPGSSYELVGEFADLDDARRYLERLEEALGSRVSPQSQPAPPD